jgi:hypothetical protein
MKLWRKAAIYPRYAFTYCPPFGLNLSIKNGKFRKLAAQGENWRIFKEYINFGRVFEQTNTMLVGDHANRLLTGQMLAISIIKPSSWRAKLSSFVIVAVCH